MSGATDEATLFPLPPLPHRDADQGDLTFAHTEPKNTNQGILPIIEVAGYDNGIQQGHCRVCHILVGDGTPGCARDNIRCDHESDPDSGIDDPFNYKAG